LIIDQFFRGWLYFLLEWFQRDLSGDPLVALEKNLMLEYYVIGY